MFWGKIYSQKTLDKDLVLLKSAITSVGSSASIPVDKKYNIIQSIGQSGNVGTIKSNSITVQQGYITNCIVYTVDNSKKEEFEEKLDLVISPNPFVEYIRIDFAKKMRQEVSVQIFDSNGRYVFSEQYQPTNSIVIPMLNFATSTYLVVITSGKDHFTKKIIKVQ